MYVINIRNVHEALPAALALLRQEGVERDSRNGPVVMFPTPVTTVYREPCERVIFWPERDANPFFHLFESLWMLAGRNDVEYLTRFVSTMGQFSDDGETFHGAYGYRWRHAFGFDQLKPIVDRLRANPEDRRQVLQMYDAEKDLEHQEGKKDIPCNLTVTFQMSHTGELDMMVFNRSNDLIWGCYGANAVHFSVLQEYVAARIGAPVGMYWQVSHNLHAYWKTLEPIQHLADEFVPPEARLTPASPYESHDERPAIVRHYALMKDDARWHGELLMFIDQGWNAMGYQEHFFRKIAVPMLRAWDTFKETGLGFDRYATALRELSNMPLDSDWYLACRDWICRRRDKAVAKAAAEDAGAIYE